MPQSLKSLPLFVEASSPPPRLPEAPRSRRSGQLWVAVHLPQLPLEALSAAVTRETAIVELQKGRHRVIASSDGAHTLGVVPGLELSAALALSRSLNVLDRSPDAESQRLVALAHWSRRFTPTVSLEPPHALLLEIRGSLGLWGGVNAIKKALTEECRHRGLTAHLCLAPTALAALWLARSGQKDVNTQGELSARLGRLSLEVTEWPQSTLLQLRKMGVRTIGDCLRLPRDGLGRRIGQRFLLELDKSLGQPDLRPEFEPAKRLSSRLSFDEETANPEVLANVGKRLITRLATALRSHQVQVDDLEFTFHHLGRPATVERIRFVVPTSDLEKFLRLFLNKLEAIVLPAPVTAIHLRTGRVEPLLASSTSLFPTRTPIALQTALGELIERLRIRFGEEDIHGVVQVEEHRPEVAWAKSKDPLDVSGSTIPPRNQARPLWILPAPVQLPDAPSGTPRCENRKPLRLESGPERIEAGWWEGQDVSRDYYIASSSNGERLWVYRDRYSTDRDWYLHGIFG